MGGDNQNMDERRQLQMAYEYLCHLEEAKLWLESNLKIELPPSTELEEYFRPGIVLAQVAHFFAPEALPLKRIYDIDYVQYKKKGLHFKYSDNIIGFIKAMSHIKFPKVFYPETTDIYDMKNMPKVIYCLHALSMYLYKLGLATPIQDLLGKVQFKDDEISKMADSLNKYGVQMPAFSKIGGILASELSENDAAMHAAIILINETLEKEDLKEFREKLNNPAAFITGVEDDLIELYMLDMIAKRKQKLQNFEASGKDPNECDVYDKNLTQAEIHNIVSAINLTTTLAKITEATRNENEKELVYGLCSKYLGLNNVMMDNSDFYLSVCSGFLKDKENDYIFTIDDLSSLIHESNVLADIRRNILEFTRKVNTDMMTLDKDQLNELLGVHGINIPEYNSDNVDSYIQWFQHERERIREKYNDPTAELGFDDIKKTVLKCNAAVKEANDYIKYIEDINQLLMQSEKPSNSHIKDRFDEIRMKGVIDDCLSICVDKLKQEISERNFVDWNGWLDHNISDKQLSFFYNHNNKDFRWFSTADLQSNHGFFNKSQLQDRLNYVTEEYNKEQYIIANTPSLILIQNYFRTSRVLDSYKMRPFILTLQALARTSLECGSYKNVRNENTENVDKIRQLQSFIRTQIMSNILDKRRTSYKKNIKKIVALQSIIRANQVNFDFHNFVSTENPTCKAVSKFVSLLEFDANDFQEEAEVAALRDKAASKIKEVNQKELEIREMDVKIGLLVKNRLNVQDVLAAPKNKKKQNVSEPVITKDKMALIEKLGIMFYILQTNPDYTANLILNFFGDRKSKFVTDTCYAIYNYGSDTRDDFSLLRMFSKAMLLEVETRIQSIQEFTKGDPMIIKMVVGFYRSLKAQTWLSEMLLSPVEEVLNNKLTITTNSLEIYKTWISQIETETGKASGYPYDIDTETALTYDEVKKRLAQNIELMGQICNKFVDAITNNFEKLPYGIKYLAKSLYNALEQRFPCFDSIEYIKIIGNLVYYRLINPAIIAPDQFNITTNTEITAEKRKALAGISAILQRSVSHSFVECSESDNPLLSLNVHMKSIWERMSAWLMKCTEVEDVGLHFNMDEFSDQVAIKRPELNLQLEQIIQVHSLCKQYVEDNNLNENLASVIKEIGELPDLKEIVDKSFIQSGASDEEIEQAILGVNIRLSLIPPQVEFKSDEDKMKKLLKSTIMLIVDLMHFEPLDSISKIIKKGYSDEQEKAYTELQTKRRKLIKTFRENTPKDDKTAEESKEAEFATLKGIKEDIKTNIAVLEEAKVISSENDYQSLVVVIASEIRNRRAYRKNRRYDLLRLRGVIDNLSTKENFLNEQNEYYNQYIQACMNNLQSNIGAKKSKNSSIKPVKIPAHKLHSTGVVLDIEGLNKSQFKNVLFEIVPSPDAAGVFKVSAKVYGVKMESVDLSIRDLLQLRYENVSIIKLFERARVNVNLLIYTINSKFYTGK